MAPERVLHDTANAAAPERLSNERNSMEYTRVRLRDTATATLIGVAAIALALAVSDAARLWPEHPSDSLATILLSSSVVVACAVGAIARRRTVIPTLTWALFAFAVVGRLEGSASSPVPAVMAMVIVAVAISLHSEPPRPWLAALLSVLVLLMTGWSGAGAMVAVAAAVATASLSAMVLQVRLQAHRLETAYDSLFVHSPLVLIEQDWSDILEWLESLRASGIQNIGEYLRENPETLPWSWGLVQNLKMNPEALALDPSPAVPDPSKLSTKSLDGHRDTLVDFFNGRYHRTVTFPMADDRGKVHWHHVSSFPLDPERPGRMIVAAADVTVLREAKEELEELVRSKNRFIAAISHELRTPMAAVLGFAAELRRRPEQLNAEERDELLDLVLEQAQEASNIIEDLLVAARADMSAVSTVHSGVDVRHEIEHVLAVYQHAAELVCPDDLPPVCADAARVRQIMRNLLTNAIRHGGPERRIVCSTDGNVVSIEMRDDGDTLSPEEMDALFEPYTRGYEAIGMTESIGIGLTVSRYLAGLMRGSLTGHRNGNETVFRLTLPVVGHCQILDQDRAGKTASL